MNAYKLEHYNTDYLEQKITELLQQHAFSIYAKNIIAPHVARKSLLANHLYEDLGFKNRIEMAHYMNLHFPELSKRKPKEKLWKKFLYDSIGEVAPSCAHCSDATNCFACAI